MKFCSTIALLALISGSFASLGGGYFSIETVTGVQLKLFLSKLDKIIYAGEEISAYVIENGLVKAYLTMNANGRLVMAQGRDRNFLVDVSKGDLDGYLSHKENEIFCLRKTEVFVSDSGCQNALEVKIRFWKMFS
ncbi:hypothetical protein METBIDRAFT_33174 [Metschnikowia bicuspidata var. bicuspidata NRRL YB-4993]|uniref:Hyphally-regulated cell wall protein N-terminal domain-containing protein n=1 Tax=Metschnikowia bicuspidata var. bicuspidata NRRL YB-4993 TaxID=869754 RepID=A0A1A0H6G3_9ASCO|nr:hypothetical protein METBIDRAFT_33174 [Metschnikowia bicuspidata var. bicuspidata NRRL YB-4993]OBA19497.1 hypothetical protein METBIDRAFT_33174 [Metschnikowia bicuspidata var. bicuspidata NRRL YB-4993]